jgi:hypothetical protein
MRKHLIYIISTSVLLCAVLIILGVLFLVPRDVNINVGTPRSDLRMGKGGKIRGDFNADIQLENKNFVPVGLAVRVTFQLTSCQTKLGEGHIDQTVLPPREGTRVKLQGNFLYDPTTDTGFCVLHAISQSCPSTLLRVNVDGVATYSTWIKSGERKIHHVIDLSCAQL